MYSKIFLGLLAISAASAANIVKRDGDHGHGHGGGGGGGGHAAAPSDGYGAPAQSYGAPAQSYGAPAQSYGAPAPSYGAPAPSYSAPSSGYGEVQGYEEEGGFDLTVIIIPLLILLGLSLLFPGIVSVDTRRKREAVEGAGKTHAQHNTQTREQLSSSWQQL